MKLKKLISLVLSLAIVSSYAVQGVAAAPIENDPETQLASGSQEDPGAGTTVTPEPGVQEEPGADSPTITDPGSQEEPGLDSPAITDPGSQEEPGLDSPTTPDSGSQEEPGADSPTTPDSGSQEDPGLDSPTTTDPDSQEEPGSQEHADDLKSSRAITSSWYDYRYYGVDSSFPVPVGSKPASDYYLKKKQQEDSTYTLSFSSFLSIELQRYSSTFTLPKADFDVNNVTDFIVDIDGTDIKYRFLPTQISHSDMTLIYNNLNNSAKLSFPIADPDTHVTYNAVLSKSNANGLAQSGGDVNLALYFNADQANRTLRVSLVNKPNGSNGSIDYKIQWEEFNKLLDPLSLVGYALTMYNGKNGSIEKPIVSANTDAAFTLNKENGYSVYFTIWDETEYITKSEAQALVKDAIGNLNKADIEELQAQVQDLQNQIKKLDDKYLTESEINDLINSYFKKETNLTALVEAIFKHEKFDDLVEKKLKEYLSIDSSDFSTFKSILIGYIISQVTTELKNLDTRLEKLETLISKAIEGQLGNIFNQNTTLDSLRDFILGLQLLESLKGKDGVDGKDGKDGVDGKDGKDGVDGKDGENGRDGLNGLNGRDGLNGKDGLNGLDGEDFAEWATRNYGGISNFINQISFEGWARSNYGSVDNFIRSISGTNGFSAYELAVQNGYYGSLGQWLESLRGKDGKSAYELAVENGYNGTERQWLDSLQGEDGADGEDGRDGKDGMDGADGRDGRDGRDGSVVYVNGTYGELPSSNNASVTAQSPSAGSTNGSTNSDVILTIDPPASYGSKGAAANPATGAAVGIFLPAAAAVSVLLVKKGGRKRGRK